jgi:hypothetical protein
MDWYYAAGEERRGPFGEEEFHRLVQQGVVTSATLVWREGMENWQPYAGSASSQVSAGTPAADVTCSGCGRAFGRTEVIPLLNGLYCAACKGVELQRLKEGVTFSSAAEDTRKQYLKHEASVRSVGFLYYLGGVALGIVGFAGIWFSALPGSFRPGPAPIEILLSIFFLGVGIGQFFVGVGLRRLKSWARIPTGIFSGIGLLGFPMGTIINGYILYLIFSRKGKMVFSDEYRVIIEQTPHIKYRTSIVVWILLGLLLLLIGMAFIGVFLGRASRSTF